MQWYYTENGQQMGPISEADLGGLIAAGRIGVATLIWRDGMEHWLPLGEVSAQGGLEVLPPSMGYELLRPGKNSGFAIASMICGIVAVIPCLGFVGIPAVVCGHVAMHQIDNSRNLIVGKGMATAGLILGYTCLTYMLIFALGIAL
jgi:hypothetical protein